MLGELFNDVVGDFYRSHQITLGLVPKDRVVIDHPGLEVNFIESRRGLAVPVLIEVILPYLALNWVWSALFITTPCRSRQTVSHTGPRRKLLRP